MLTKEQEEKLAAEARRLFGTRLGMARAAIYPDQDSAGKVLGFKKRRWGGYEAGRREPPLWFLMKLPAMFHRPLSWFFDLPDERALDDKESRIISLLRSLDDPVIRSAAIDGTISQLERQVQMQALIREREAHATSR